LEILAYLFFSAVFGAALSQYTFFYGLHYTTATFAITFINHQKKKTFLLAATPILFFATWDPLIDCYNFAPLHRMPIMPSSRQCPDGGELAHEEIPPIHLLCVRVCRALEPFFALIR
jgi:hypothetical protein